MEFKFDLQRFKGQTTSSEATYTPTEYELQLQQYAVQYAQALAPNAQELNNYAMGVIKPSFEEIMGGTEPLGKYHIKLNGEAQERATSALHALIYTSPQENLNAAYAANTSLTGLADDYSSVAESGANNQNNLATALNNKVSDTADSLTSIYDSLGNSTDETNNSLKKFTASNDAAMLTANNGLSRVICNNCCTTRKYTKIIGGIADSNISVTSGANENLDEYITINSGAESLASNDIDGYQVQNSIAATTTNDTLGTYRTQNTIDTSAAKAVSSRLCK